MGVKNIERNRIGNRAGFRGLALAVAVAGVWWIAGNGPLALAAPGQGKSIFDDDFPASKEPAPAAKPPAGNQPAPVAPPGPKENPAAGAVDENMMPGLVAELYEKGQLKEAKVVKRIRITLTATADKAIPIYFKWHGMINIPPGGMAVTFRVNTLAAGELVLDGRKVADEKGGTPLRLAPGPHPITVTVSQIIGHGVKEEISLRWTPAEEELQNVPSTVFFHKKQEEPAGAEKGDLVSSSGKNPDQGMPASSRLPGGSPAPNPAAPAPANPPVPAEPTAKLPADLPVPSEAQLAEIHKAIRAKYAADYADTARIVHQALARKLMDNADARSITVPERYVLLKEAADLSVATGDLKTALTCVDLICSSYKVNRTEMTLGILTTAAHLPKALEIGHEVGDAALTLSDRARQETEIDEAVRAAQLAETAYGASADAARAKSALKDLREIQAQSVRVAPLLKKLKETPDDPELNAKVGRYFCFTAGNWARGLPMLARGSDAALKALAGVESTRPADAAGQLQLGDNWWEKSASEPTASATACKDRAAFWYDRARAGMRETVPARVLERLATLSRNIDLLPGIKVENMTTTLPNNGLPGERTVPTAQTELWAREGGNLICRSGAYATALQLNYRPAGEYDFIVEFTIAKGSGSIAQMFPARGSLLEWDVHGEYANFTRVALRPGSFGPVLKGRVPVVAGQKYVSVVQFRRNGVRGYLNNVLVREWLTDYTEIGTSVDKMPDPQCIGLKASGDEVIISAIRVVEVGHGK